MERAADADSPLSSSTRDLSLRFVCSHDKTLHQTLCVVRVVAYDNFSQRGDTVAVKAVRKRLLFSDNEKKSVRAEIDNQLRIVHK